MLLVFMLKFTFMNKHHVRPRILLRYPVKGAHLINSLAHKLFGIIYIYIYT